MLLVESFTEVEVKIKMARVNNTKAQIYESTNAMDLEMFLQIPTAESPLGIVYCQTHLHKNGYTE